MTSIYVSTGYQAKARARDFAKRAHAVGFDVTCRWWDLDARLPELGYQGIAHDECRGVCAADVFVLLLPGALGSHFELGLALRNGARVIVVGAGQTDELKAQACIFYTLPTIEHAASEDEALAMITAGGDTWGH